MGLILSLLFAFVVIPRVAFAETTPMTEAQFIELAGAETPGDGGSRTPTPKPAAETPKKKDDEPAGGEDGDQSDGAGDGDAGDQGDKGDDGEGDDEGAGEGAEGDEGEGEGEEEDEDGKGADGPTAEEDAAFKKALAEQGVEVTLEDIPEEARPIVAKKLKDLERGFHAKMRDLSEDQKAARAFRTEERFRREHTVDYLVAMLFEHPELSDKVNARIEDLGGNDTALEGHKALVEKARREAAEAEAGEDRKVEEHAKKIDEYIRIGRAAARAAGVPFEAGVEDAMAARLALGEALTTEDIREIAAKKAVVYKRNMRQHKRRASEEYVKGKVADSRKAGLRVKPGAGRAPTPGARKMATSDEEFINEFSSRGG